MNPNHTAVKVSHTSQVSQRWNIMTHTWTENGKHSRQYKKTVQNIWAKAAMTYDLCSQTTRTRVYVLLRLVSAWGVLPIWTKTHRTSLRENEIRVSLNLLAHLYTHMHTHSPAQVHLHQAMIWGWKVSQAICWHPPPSLPAAPTTTSSSVYKYTTLWVFSRAASSNRYSWGESVTVTAWETHKRRKKKKSLAMWRGWPAVCTCMWACVSPRWWRALRGMRTLIWAHCPGRRHKRCSQIYRVTAV